MCCQVFKFMQMKVTQLNMNISLSSKENQTVICSENINSKKKFLSNESKRTNQTNLVKQFIVHYTAQKMKFSIKDFFSK